MSANTRKNNKQEEINEIIDSILRLATSRERGTADPKSLEQDLEFIEHDALKLRKVVNSEQDEYYH